MVFVDGAQEREAVYSFMMGQALMVLASAGQRVIWSRIHQQMQGKGLSRENGESNSLATTIIPSVGLVSQAEVAQLADQVVVGESEALTKLSWQPRSGTSFSPLPQSTSSSLASSSQSSPTTLDPIAEPRVKPLSHKLPTIPTKTECVDAISSETLGLVLEGRHDDKYDRLCIIDCRFGNEYRAGHIRGARHVTTPDYLLRLFFPDLNDTISQQTFSSSSSSSSSSQFFQSTMNNDRAELSVYAPASFLNVIP